MKRDRPWVLDGPREHRLSKPGDAPCGEIDLGIPEPCRLTAVKPDGALRAEDLILKDHCPYIPVFADRYQRRPIVFRDWPIVFDSEASHLVDLKGLDISAYQRTGKARLVDDLARQFALIRHGVVELRPDGAYRSRVSEWWVEERDPKTRERIHVHGPIADYEEAVELAVDIKTAGYAARIEPGLVVWDSISDDYNAPDTNPFARSRR
jgi:hypothetical protein